MCVFINRSLSLRRENRLVTKDDIVVPLNSISQTVSRHAPRQISPSSPAHRNNPTFFSKQFFFSCAFIREDLVNELDVMIWCVCTMTTCVGWKLISSISGSRLPHHTGSCSVYRRCSAWFACIRTFTFICVLILLMRSVESRDLKLHYQCAVFVDKSEFFGVVLFFFTLSSLCSSLNTFYSLII